MRIWDIPVHMLCRQHLLGEHRELHCIWSILTENRKCGYRNHPETIRWNGKLPALFLRHQEQVFEMTKRGYKHKTPLSLPVSMSNNIQHFLTGEGGIQSILLMTKEDQIRHLINRGCGCCCHNIEENKNG